MFYKAVKSDIVSHLSYVAASKGEAFVIDPRRDCDVYLEIAKNWGVSIKDIFETHRNEDYVIGSVELSKLTGAKIHHGPGLPWKYGEIIYDGEEFKIGLLKIVALHTPGHSPDSTCYALIDTESGDKPVMVFTGDTLFVGDVGRTDILGAENTGLMAGKLYDGLHTKILPLGDGVIVLPGHGFGSVCGGSISEREISTIGAERMMNPMLKLSRADFIERKEGEKHESAPYFKVMERYNLEGPPIPDHRLTAPALTANEFKAKMAIGTPVIDTRHPPAYAGAHIEGSFSLAPSRLSNTGWIVPVEREILLIVDDVYALDFAVTNLYRIGYSSFAGYLAGGLEAWYTEGFPVSKVDLLTSPQLLGLIRSGEMPFIIDVRRQNEWGEGHIEGAHHIYLGRLPERLDQVPFDVPIVVHCKTGTRSSLAASIFLRAGRKRVYNLLGGIDAWRKLSYPLVRS